MLTYELKLLCVLTYRVRKFHFEPYGAILLTYTYTNMASLRFVTASN